MDNTNSDPNQQYKDILNQYAQDIKTDQPPQELPIEETPILPTSPQPIEIPQPEQPKIEDLDLPPIDPTPPIVVEKPQNNLFKILFFIALFIFISVVGVIAYNLSTNNQSSTNNISTPEPTATPTTATFTCTLNDKQYMTGESFASADGCNTCTCATDGNIACTEKACASTNSATTKITPTKSATSSAKTSFQKLIINWAFYKEITTSEKNTSFNTFGSFWTSSLKQGDTLYDFSQKIIKGSVKKLTINKSNLNTILGNYEYTFYLTPNYEKWSNEKFVEKDLVPLTGIGDLSPVYAYSDKLIWSTSLNCGGRRSDDPAEQKAQDQCQSLVEEINTAFP